MRRVRLKRKRKVEGRGRGRERKRKEKKEEGERREREIGSEALAFPSSSSPFDLSFAHLLVQPVACEPYDTYCTLTRSACGLVKAGSNVFTSWRMTFCRGRREDRMRREK